MIWVGLLKLIRMSDSLRGLAEAPEVRRFWRLNYLFWFAVNLLFEAGQHPQVREPLAETLRRALGTGPAARPLENYFLRGTFDAGDVAAAALGAVAAALLLSRLRQARQYHHAPSPLPL